MYTVFWKGVVGELLILGMKFVLQLQCNVVARNFE